LALGFTFKTFTFNTFTPKAFSTAVLTLVREALLETMKEYLLRLAESIVAFSVNKA
jgi:hypothetical protein